ncbi:MAG: hypothetical protein PHO63_03640 [Bacilli bacterium]|nr:hypothetical protein [Bacilli bacterium]MDD4809364.1 hypothetical protein [Bacilli bacterium]
MKKHNLLKTIGIVFLIFVVLSWIIPISSFSSNQLVKGSIDPIGLLDLIYYPMISIATFIQYGILILVIGGFYGVINKTGVYSKLVNYFIEKTKNNEKQFLVILISLLALLASLTGLPWVLLILVPFFMTVILSLGFGKLTAIASTIGAILVGITGSTYGTNSSYIMSNVLLGIHTDIVAKFGLLVLVTFLLITFVLTKANKDLSKKVEKTEETTKNKKKTTADEKKVVSKVKVEKPLYEETESSKKSFWPLVIIIDLLILILLLAGFNWDLTFGVKYFTDLYYKIAEVTIGDVPILSNILGSSLTPFGYWDTYLISIMVIIVSLLIGWVYNIKFNEIITSFGEGAKKVIKPALLVMLANVVFVVVASSQSGNVAITITNYITSLSEGVNVFTATLASAFGTFFFNDFRYLIGNIMAPIKSVWINVEFYSVMAIVIQSIHGLMQLFLPTSMILIAGLSLCDVSYKEWLSYIWKFLIQILVVILIIAIILTMLV